MDVKIVLDNDVTYDIDEVDKMLKNKFKPEIIRSLMKFFLERITEENIKCYENIQDLIADIKNNILPAECRVNLLTSHGLIHLIKKGNNVIQDDKKSILISEDSIIVDWVTSKKKPKKLLSKLIPIFEHTLYCDDPECSELNCSNIKALRNHSKWCEQSSTCIVCKNIDRLTNMYKEDYERNLID
jgi:hypothetical protein